MRHLFVEFLYETGEVVLFSRTRGLFMVFLLQMVFKLWSFHSHSLFQTYFLKS